VRIEEDEAGEIGRSLRLDVERRKDGEPEAVRCDDVQTSVLHDRRHTAFGGYGERVEKLEGLGPAVARAFAAGKPACINVAIDPNVVHPLTTSMLGDVTSTTEIVVPYYENIPL
jgi:thiamine pyrophosphate-dependent acetolactate synthase large subunit-like protein